MVMTTEWAISQRLTRSPAKLFAASFLLPREPGEKTIHRESAVSADWP